MSDRSRGFRLADVVTRIGVLAVIVGAIVSGGIGGPIHSVVRASVEIPSTPPPSPWPK